MKTITNILLLLIAVSLSACYKAHDERVNVRPGVRSGDIGTNVITRPFKGALSALAGEGIEITDVKQFKNEAGFLEVQVTGYNAAMYTKRFEYKVEWLDANGIVLETKTSTWLPVSVTAKAVFAFKAVAPRRQAENFRVITRK